MSDTFYELVAIDTCPACNGSGKVDALPKTCPVCKGTGMVRTVIGRGATVSKALAEYVSKSQQVIRDVIKHKLAEATHDNDEPVVAPV